MPETTPAPDLTALSHEMLIGVIEQAAQMSVTSTGIPGSSRTFWSQCRAELLSRLARAADPDAGRVTISREDAHLAWNVLLEREQAADNVTRRMFGDCADRFAAALAQAGTEGETE